MNTTATVEVLTAEVRVLMVGSRQITLSVARQLDYVPVTSLEPFGRVRLGSDEPDWLTLIGAASGVLSLATLRRERTTCAPYGYSHLCPEHRPAWEAALAQGAHPAATAWDRHPHTRYTSQGGVEVTADVRHRLGALPLIVLAGLR